MIVQLILNPEIYQCFKSITFSLLYMKHFFANNILYIIDFYYNFFIVNSYIIYIFLCFSYKTLYLFVFLRTSLNMYGFIIFQYHKVLLAIMSSIDENQRNILCI